MLFIFLNSNLCLWLVGFIMEHKTRNKFYLKKLSIGVWHSLFHHNVWCLSKSLLRVTPGWPISPYSLRRVFLCVVMIFVVPNHNPHSFLHLVRISITAIINIFSLLTFIVLWIILTISVSLSFIKKTTFLLA